MICPSPRSTSHNHRRISTDLILFFFDLPCTAAMAVLDAVVPSSLLKMAQPQHCVTPSPVPNCTSCTPNTCERRVMAAMT